MCSSYPTKYTNHSSRFCFCCDFQFSHQAQERSTMHESNQKPTPPVFCVLALWRLLETSLFVSKWGLARCSKTTTLHGSDKSRVTLCFAKLWHERQDFFSHRLNRLFDWSTARWHGQFFVWNRYKPFSWKHLRWMNCSWQTNEGRIVSIIRLSLHMHVVTLEIWLHRKAPQCLRNGSGYTT